MSAIDAVRSVMSGEPGRAWRAPEIADELNEMGWPTVAIGAIRVVLHRLTVAGEFERVSRGVYRGRDRPSDAETTSVGSSGPPWPP
jgi:hypothetical protein